MGRQSGDSSGDSDALRHEVGWSGDPLSGKEQITDEDDEPHTGERMYAPSDGFPDASPGYVPTDDALRD